MKFLVKTVSLLAVVAAAAMVASSQDLGSANKLFGAGSKTTPKKKRTAAKTPSVHTAVAKKKPAPAKVSAKKVSPGTEAKKTSGKPSREITTPTGTKITKPSKPSTDTTAKKTPIETATRFAETMVSPADAARFEQLIEQGNAARDDREYARAESAYKNARAIKARDSRATHGLGNVYSDQQRWEEAENAYRAALQVEPSSASTLVALSYVLTQPLAVADLSERYAEAERLARRASEISPRNPLAYDQLGVAMEMRGQLGSATESAYRKAIQLDPSCAPAYAHLGRLLRRRGAVDQSRDAYRQATERSTGVGAMVVVAEVMQSEQRFADSIPLLQQALNADPRNPSALIMMGHALTVTGQYRDAESTLQRALAVGSNGYVANSLLASLYSRQGAYELAEKALLQALRTAPANEHRQLAQAFIRVAQGYAKMGKSDQAKRAYAKAAELDADSGALSGRFRP